MQHDNFWASRRAESYKAEDLIEKLFEGSSLTPDSIIYALVRAAAQRTYLLKNKDMNTYGDTFCSLVNVFLEDPPDVDCTCDDCVEARRRVGRKISTSSVN